MAFPFLREITGAQSVALKREITVCWLIIQPGNSHHRDEQPASFQAPSGTSIELGWPLWTNSDSRPASGKIT